MSQSPRYAIVTGAASGLGRAIALQLASAGWTIALVDRNEQALDETAQRVAEQGGTAEPVAMDVTQADAWCTLRERLQAAWPRLDLLVNNAGVSCGGEATRLSLDDWQWVLAVNLDAVITGCHTMIPWLVENEQGAHLINTASAAGLISAPTMGPYNVSKAGVVALSETLYAELRHRGVGVTVLCPGFFQTNLLADGRFQSDSIRRAGEQHMEKSRFTADDIARLAVRSIGRRKLYVVHGWRARALWRFKRLTPAGLQRLAARLYANIVSKKD